ncbi:MAG: phospholipase D-like domain-containing protein [Bacteroidales bacterium]|nr:phospholipase D-like domain-containing protein [Bacteroidales bacterium]
MARIYDNIELKFEQGLSQAIANHGVRRVDFCVGYFNLRGWKLVVEQVETLPGDFVDEDGEAVHRTCRLLIGMHQPNEELVRQLYSREGYVPDAETVMRVKRQIARDFRRQLELVVPTAADELTLRQLNSQLKSGKVSVKLSVREPLHAKLYIAHSPQDNRCPIFAIMGSSNLTYAGLTKQGELNAEFADRDQCEKYDRWFNDRWNDRFCVDITKELSLALDESWARETPIPPYWIYLKVAYHLSEDMRAGISEYRLPQVFRSELFEFQQNAVKIVARHLKNEKRKGAMIGDVVGLGKTITACAVAKIWENYDGGSTLIICPANLQEMWAKYIKKYDLKAEVRSMAKPIDIDSMRHFKLVIIDESHNLRNRGKRYVNIKEFIHSQTPSVLLLTATPYNKEYSDLGNQLRLFLDDSQDLGVRPERYIESLGGERGFLGKHSDTHPRSIEAFLKSDKEEDWNDLMKLFLVRRTRSFIKENFAKTDPQSGRKYLEFSDGRKSYFPDRIPKSIKFPTENGDQFSRLYSEEIMDCVDELKLPRYGLSNYLSPKEIADAPEHHKIIIDGLSKAGESMKGFCKSTFFKRMDSSGFSFLLTLYRHVFRNCVYLYAIGTNRNLPIRDDNNLPEDYSEEPENATGGMFGEEEQVDAVMDGSLEAPTELSVYMDKAADYYAQIEGKSNVAWLPPKYFKRSLKQQLLKDCETVLSMIRICGKWEQKNDQKLNELERLLEGSDHGADKVVVFTQYADTAKYLYNQLRKRGIKRVDYVTGNSENPTAKVEKFSPESNDKKLAPEEQTRVLIATDVLSEGQNLQDSHVVVNFDLPWAIIRLIQRAGRVDRIGQKAEQIFCYSFFPADGIEEIINLRGRLNERINQNAQIVGSDEIFFEGNEQNLRDMFNEKAGALDDEEDNEVDLASMAYQIWNDAVKADKSLKDKIPALANLSYSTKPADGTQQGVITYGRTREDFDILSWSDADGQLVSQSQKRILQALACEPSTPAVEPLANHHELVADAAERMQEQSSMSMNGALGSRFSVRYRIIQLLQLYQARETDLFFSSEKQEELKYVIDDMYKYPIDSAAKTHLGSMLRGSGKSSDDDIVDMVLELHRNGQLCIIDDSEDKRDKYRIICSMGMKNQEA